MDSPPASPSLSALTSSYCIIAEAAILRFELWFGLWFVRVRRRSWIIVLIASKLRWVFRQVVVEARRGDHNNIALPNLQIHHPTQKAETKLQFLNQIMRNEEFFFYKWIKRSSLHLFICANGVYDDLMMVFLMIFWWSKAACVIKTCLKWKKKEFHLIAAFHYFFRGIWSSNASNLI